MTTNPPPRLPNRRRDRGVCHEDQVKLALRRVKDPDLQLNIMDLGLVYGIAVDGTTVKVDMTLTSPACPSGPELMTNAENGAEDAARRGEGRGESGVDAVLDTRRRWSRG